MTQSMIHNENTSMFCVEIHVFKAASGQINLMNSERGESAIMTSVETVLMYRDSTCVLTVRCY